MVKIEIIEEGGIKSGTSQHLKGEVLISANEEQEFKYRSWVQAGIAKNLDTGEVCERQSGAVKLDVQSIKQSMSSEIK